MAISSYELYGKTYWKVYVDLRGRGESNARVQKRIMGLKSEREAIAAEKRLIRELSTELSHKAAQGVPWSEIIDRWVRQQELYPTKRLAKTTLQDYEAVLRNYTKKWLTKNASELNRADGREAIQAARDSGRGAKFCRGFKYTINLVYMWGVEERLIPGVQTSPVFGLEVEPDREEKRPEILTIEEIRKLLRMAKEQNHPWYPTWVGAVLTGCRSGELHELRRSDLEVISREQAIHEDKKPFDKRRYGFLRVRRGYNTRVREVGPTKAGYWRNVPISSEFYWFLVHDLRIEEKQPTDHIFPRSWAWDKGAQAKILRMFCISNKLPSVRFHALRACFATQLIASGVPATVVMKICGWRDMKTMQRYIRLAGVEEAGATEILRFIPTEEAVMEKVVSMYDYKKE